MTAQSVRVGLEGVPKNVRLNIRSNRATVALLRAKKPDPLVCSPGGVAKDEINSNTHQTRLTNPMKRAT